MDFISRSGIRTLSSSAYLLRNLLLLCILAITVAARLAQTPQSQAKPAEKTAYTIKRLYKVGEAERYRLVNKTAIEGPQSAQIEMEWILKETTKRIRPDGTALLVVTFDKATATANGKALDEMSELSHATITFTGDSTGRITDLKIQGVQGALAQGSGFERGFQLLAQWINALYPSHPVKAGDTWKIEYPAENKALPGYHTTGNATLKGTEIVDSRQVLTVKMRAEATNAETPALIMHIDALGNIEPQTGKVIHMKASIHGSSQQGSITVTDTLDLLQDQDKKPGSNPSK